MRMKHFFKYSFLLLAALLMEGRLASAQAKTKKILVIGVDGIISTAIDYAATPGIGAIKSNASYSMSGYGGIPAYTSSGWSTMLTGVSADKHGVTSNGSFSGNNFGQYPSVVNRLKTALSALVVASVVRTTEINTLLNGAADQKFQFATDEEVYNKSVELLKQADMGAVFVQFSSPADVGQVVGFQLRQAQYVLAIQKIDQYVAGLHSAIESRSGYTNKTGIFSWLLRVAEQNPAYHKVLPWKKLMYPSYYQALKWIRRNLLVLHWLPVKMQTIS